MGKGIIRLGFQKIISDATTSLWDKYVFDATWMEYRMQAANYYNTATKSTLFTTILNETPAAAQLHGAVSTAAMGYINQLNGIIPGLQNAHGKNVIPFKNFSFQIIQSDIMDSKLHKVEIIFISEPLTLIDVFNYHYLVAIGDQQQHLQTGNEVTTELIPQTDQLSIYSFKNFTAD